MDKHNNKAIWNKGNGGRDDVLYKSSSVAVQEDDGGPQYQWFTVHDMGIHQKIRLDCRCIISTMSQSFGKHPKYLPIFDCHL